MPPRDAGPPPPPSDGPPLPKPDAGRGGLLADIRGGARLKKVSDQEKKDRSHAAVPGTEPPAGAAGGSGAATPGADAGLAGALASALAARKAKVSHSGIYFPLFTRIHILISVQTMSRIRMIGS
jgi:hypothetical protein